MDRMNRNVPKCSARAEKKSGVENRSPHSDVFESVGPRFTAATAQDDELLLDYALPNDFDTDEWSW